MKNMLLKDFTREIKRNKGRFLSIFFIVLLGSAFFSGIRSSGGDMKYSADIYYDKTNMMDIKVISTLGLTDDDIADIKKADGVLEVNGGYTAEALTSTGKSEHSIRIIANDTELNKLEIKDGREPQRADECVVDAFFMESCGYKIGDTISVYSGTDDDISDTLSQTEFTVVGSGNLPYFTDLTRGVSSIGDGQLDGFLVVDPEAFNIDYYTEAYVTVDGAKELNTYSDEYDTLVGKTVKSIEDISEKAAQRRYDEIYAEGSESISEAEEKIENARSELDNAKTELDDGKAELDASAEKLGDAKAELDSSEKLLTDTKSQLDSALSQLNTAKTTLSQAKSEIDKNEATLAEAKNKIDSGETQINAALAEIEAKDTALAAAKTELAEKQSELDAMNEAINGLKQQYNETETAYQAVQQQLEKDPANEELIAQAKKLKSTLDTLSSNIAKGEETTSAAENAIKSYEQSISDGENALKDAKTKIEKERSALESSRAEYEAGAAKLAAAKSEYESGLAQYESSLAQYNAGLAEYNEGLSKYEAGRAEYEDGLKEYNDGLAKWQEGSEEYDTAYKDAQSEIADAEKKIEDGKAELEKLSVPTWYVLDRDDISSCSAYGNDAERMDNIGQVFPVMFFLVAALVSLTAMTRMAQEQRGQIGTLKGLGYSTRAIAGKYVGYALLATVSGAVIGVLLGERIMPLVVMTAYGMLYTGITEYFTPLNYAQGTLSVALLSICTGFAAFASVYSLLSEKPAELMRPEAPRSGRRIFLEHIPFLWKRFNFTYKATLRNLFRYKKRFIMTIIGIGGCMSLLLVGFGLRDSITVVAKNQFVDLFMQDATITLDTDGDVDELEEIADNYEGIEARLDIYQQTVTLNANNHNRDAYLYVPENTDEADEFVDLRDRITKETYEFPSKGVALSEKTAEMLGVSVGDEISIKKGEQSEAVYTYVEEIVENYVMHYVFMSPTVYEQLYGEAPEYNCIFLKYDDTSAAYENALGNRLLKCDACSGVSFTSDLEKQINDMLNALNIVIAVMIISAALLAFVVLYNLNSINITERRRELATLKVLGFYDTEVAMYIYRENILLSIIGIFVGIFLGKLLHLFTVTTIEVDQMMFGRTLSIESYIICAILTFAFSILVNIIMFHNFKKIDMVESLKSVE